MHDAGEYEAIQRQWRIIMGGMSDLLKWPMVTMLFPQSIAGLSINMARGEPGGGATTTAKRWQPNIYLAMEPSGEVFIIAHRSEMGTGARTGPPMVATDELGADWDRVTVEQAIGDPAYGSQDTDGSRSIRDFYNALRVAGATARSMLQKAAAERWGIYVFADKN